MGLPFRFNFCLLHLRVHSCIWFLFGLNLFKQNYPRFLKVFLKFATLAVENSLILFSCISLKTVKRNHLIIRAYDYDVELSSISTDISDEFCSCVELSMLIL